MTGAEGLFEQATTAFRGRDEHGAEALLRRALTDDPEHTPSLNLLALIAGRAGRYDETVALLERALRHLTDAEAVAAATLLQAAACERCDRLAEAEAAYRRVLAARPASTQALIGLCGLLRAQGRHAETLAACHTALAVAEDALALNALGIAQQALGELDAAAASFERALTLAPRLADARFNLATARKAQGRTDEAVARLRELAADAPELAEARFALCMAHLPSLYASEAEIERRRADYAAELEALSAYAERAGPGALATGVGAAQPFQLAYQGCVDVDLQRRYGELVCRAMAAAFPPTPPAAPPAPGERVRVGMVCGHIRDHSVWRLPTRGWVEGLDRARFELIGYHTSGFCDAETERARAHFDRFVQGPLSTADWRARIAADRPHALIYPEIGMDPVVAQLAALRPAPVQYASWGHPSTSGYPTIDFFLSSDAMEPPGAEAHYSERLVRLPGFSTPISPPAAAPAPPRAALGLPEGAPVFWCAQTLSKYLPGDDRLFPAIAAQAPGCRFVFIEHPESPALTMRFRQRLAAAFAAQGLEAERHCVFLPRLAPEAFRAAIGCADIVLDSVGWSGCNSLIDALAHALPIVTLPGATMRARHGLALLDQLGLADLACPDAAAYVETAARLANDPAARTAIGAAIRAALPRLADPAPVAALQRHILEACAAAPLR